MKLSTLRLLSFMSVLLCTQTLFAQCSFENLFGPVNFLAAPTFRELPVLIPDQDSRSSFNCESPSSGIDLGEYVDIEMNGTTIEAFSLVGTSIEWFLNGNPVGVNSGNTATFGGFNGTAQLANQIANPNNCDPAVAANRNIPDENIQLQCIDCPVIPSIIPQQATNGGLDSIFFSNPDFISFSNYPSTGPDPLGNAPSMEEQAVWHNFYSNASTNLLGIHRGNRIPIYPAQELFGDENGPTSTTTLRVSLQNFAFNAPGWYDDYLGISIINADGVQHEVLWSTMFPASNTVEFNLPLSSLAPSFSGSYSIQFWSTFDWVATFGCNDYSYWPGHYIAFEMNIANYTPPPPPDNDNCTDAQQINPQSGNSCNMSESGTFSYATESETQTALDMCSTQEDVWYRFVAASTQYDLSTQLVTGEGSYYVQLLSGMDCANLNNLYCEQIETSGGLQLIDLEIGTTYYLRFVREFLDDESLDFEFCLLDRETTCYIPEVTVIEQCRSNEAYELLITVADLRENSSLQVIDITQAEPLPPLTITTPGTYVFGPIPAGLNFTIQVLADESECDLIFGDFLPDCSQEPPPNNTCADALELADCLNNDFATATTTQTSCELSGAADVWFYFVPTTSVQSIGLSIAPEVNDEDIAIEVFSGDCGSLQSIYCASGRFHLLSSLNSGSPYYVMLKLPAGYENLTICREGYPAPQNEDCDAATAVPVVADCSPMHFSTIGAAPSISPLACQAANSADIWFSFLATTPTVEVQINNIIPLLNTYTGHLVLSAYRGSCGSLNEVACTTFDDATMPYTLMGLVPGQLYYFRISASIFDEYFDFDLCLTGTPAPDNDVCENAVLLPVSTDLECIDPIAGSTLAAVTPGALDCEANPVQDVWYTFTASNERHALVLNSQDFPRMQVYSGSCEALIAISGCINEQSAILNGLTPATNYFVRVMSSAGVAANFTLCVLTIPDSPTNDECVAANLLMPGDAGCSHAMSGTFLSATATGVDCFETPIGRDVWYQFVASANDQFLLVEDIEDALQPGMESFATIGFEYYDSDCNTLNSLGCVSDIAFGNMGMSGLTQGETYYVRLFMDDFSGAVNFSVCLTDNTPPANDEWANATMLIQEASVWCESALGGTFAAATSSQLTVDCDGQMAVANDDVWYQFVAATAAPTIEVAYLWGDYRIELFSADASTLLDCAQGMDLMANGLTIGDTYLVRVFSVADQALSPIEGAFTICVYGLPTTQISSLSNGACLDIDEVVVSTGSNRWLHLNHQGELVAAVFDSEPLGLLSTAYYQNMGNVRDAAGGIEYLDRNFSISPAQQPNSVVRVRLYYTQSELDALLAANDGDENDLNSFADIVVSRFAGANCSDEATGNAVLHFPTNVGFVGSGFYVEILIDHFSAFFLHGGSFALPIELTSFTGQQDLQAVRLNWITEEEHQNKGFGLERSTDGRVFEEIGWIAGQGTTSQRMYYEFYDRELPSEQATYYYRLRQEDNDGSISYSLIIDVPFQGKDTDWFVYPNPTREQLKLSIPSQIEGDFLLYNQLGQMVGRWHLSDIENKTITVDHLPAGMYWARLESGQIDLSVLQIQIQ